MLAVAVEDSAHVVLLAELVLEEPIAHRLISARATQDRDRGPASQLKSAVLAALAGDIDAAEAALRRAAASSGSPQNALLLDLAWALVMVETGNPARAARHLERARHVRDAARDPGDAAMLDLLCAESLPPEEAPTAARALAEAAVQRLPGDLADAPIGVYATLAAASLALAAGAEAEAEAHLRRIAGASGRSGLLAGRADALQARIEFARTHDARAAGMQLERAMARFERLGARRDLALAYVAGAGPAAGTASDSASRWLARGQPLLARAGGARDLRVLQRMLEPEKRLSASAEQHSVLDRSPVGHLFAVAYEIASIEDLNELTAALPELARAVCPPTAAALLRVGTDGAAEIVSRSGAPFEAHPARLSAEARAALERKEGWGFDRASSRRLALFPLSGGAERLVLAIERNASDDCLDEREVENLAVYSCLAGVALDRARTAMALQETAAREAAMLGAIGDSVIALDRAGTVRMLNEPAAAALRIGRDEIVGRVLREVPGLEPLAFVLGGAAELVADPISLPHGRFAIRPEVYPGGVVATIRDLSVEPTAGQRARRPVRYTFQHSVGEDPALVQVLENAKRAAQLDLPVLISGESGTGKEVLAQAIHRASPRASAPFVGINVIAIPRDLLESELFGYEGGAFTGARSSGRAGRFEEAGRGTLLLDEIGDMPLEMQGKLLRVLEERTVQRVGGAREVPVLARVIASTNCDLEEAVKAGRFRLDLFHRLRVVHLHLPALRERRGDVRLLVEHHLRLHAQRVHGRAVTVAPHVLAAMEAHDWPGNVRELLNLVDSELALLPAGKNTLSVIPSALRRPAPTSSTGPSASARPTEGEAVPLAEIVRRACEHALARHGGNVASAARELGIAKGTLYSKTVRRTRPEIADLQPAPAREKPER